LDGRWQADRHQHDDQQQQQQQASKQQQQASKQAAAAADKHINRIIDQKIRPQRTTAR
jgi:hypothetical protein